MKKCIEQEKLSAVTVYNGIEGVRLIDENKDSYSLIILDVYAAGYRRVSDSPKN